MTSRFNQFYQDSRLLWDKAYCVLCPKCAAPAQQLCRLSANQMRDLPHWERVNLAEHGPVLRNHTSQRSEG